MLIKISVFIILIGIIGYSEKNKYRLYYSSIMITQLHEIKEMRKKLGWTQSELAKQSSVSQSLIAKIEAGRIDPTYTKVQKIFDSLNRAGSRKELHAKDIMNPKIISVMPSIDISEAIKKMRSFGISQMPVIKSHQSIGTVSEASILEALLHKKADKVEEVMEDALPVISLNASVSVVQHLLQFFPMVLVSEDGQLKGVITKSDLLAKMYK